MNKRLLPTYKALWFLGILVVTGHLNAEAPDYAHVFPWIWDHEVDVLKIVDFKENEDPPFIEGELLNEKGSKHFILNPMAFNKRPEGISDSDYRIQIHRLYEFNFG